MSNPHPEPALVVFDLGKVLVDFDYLIAARQLGQRSDAQPERILELLLRTSLLHRYELGAIDTKEFHDTLSRQIGFVGTFADFAACFGNIFSPIHDMLRLLGQIRTGGLPTAVLSNTNELAIQFIRSHFPFFNTFNHHILSYEHRAMKPDAVLYRILESAVGVSSHQILFLDDRPENVETATHLGWHAFLHEDPDRTYRKFQSFGLLPESFHPVQPREG